MSQLRPYQRAALSFTEAVPRSGLFLDMGLGKTIITLTGLTPDRLPAYVFAPPKMVEVGVWSGEAAKWAPHLRIVEVRGTPAQRAALLRTPADVHVLSYGLMGEANPEGYRSVIFDESSLLKHHTSARFKRSAAISRQVPYASILTGTPRPKSAHDLWSQVYLLDHGKRLGRNISTFRSRFCTPKPRLPSGVVPGWDMLPGADEEIQRLISDLCLSMSTIDREDLPRLSDGGSPFEPYFNRVDVEMPKRARQLYARMKSDLAADLELIGQDGAVTARDAAALTNRLSQISAGFLYPDADDPAATTAEVHTAKLDALELIADIATSPLLVFTWYRWETEAVKRRFPGARTLDTESYAAWNRGEVDMLLAHPASAGHGLNMQDGGHTIVWMTLPWSSEQFGQANARLARGGQTDQVVAHWLHAAGIDGLKFNRVTDQLADQLQFRDFLEIL